MRLISWRLLLWLTLTCRTAGFDTEESSGDLTSFITRPEIKAPRFDVRVYDSSRVAPGYWFVASYSSMDPDPPTKKYIPCQAGPHIYDASGTLIWAGSCMVENQNVFDFKAANDIDGRSRLSFIMQRAYDDNNKKGGGMVLRDNFEVETFTPVTNDLGAFDIHEFNIVEGGRTALVTAYRPEYMHWASLGREEQGWVMTAGFEELEVATGKVVFEWSSVNHIPLSESNANVPETAPTESPGWDYIHVNSIDKNENGDYLLSARFTDAIYLISGQDGQILWRLGGKLNNFQKNFRVYRQHHARFMESNSTHMIISFFNNASDELTEDEEVSSVLVVQMNTAAVPMTATVLRRYNRPDGGLSRLRGNAQQLPNGNWFAGWSESGYHSEFTDNGTCVMEAKFFSDRFNTYRAYKFEFRGIPQEPPDVRAFVYGTRSSRLTTVFHVSWNGATEVASWNFYAQAGENTEPELVGEATKSGFETTFIADGYFDWVSVDAIDAQGSIISRSKIERTITPGDWRAAGFNPDDPLPTPQDPLMVSGNDDGEGEGESEDPAEGDDDDDDDDGEEEEENDSNLPIIINNNNNKNTPQSQKTTTKTTTALIEAEQSKRLAAEMTWKFLNGFFRLLIFLLMIRFILATINAQSRTLRRCFRRLRVSVIRPRSSIEIPSSVEEPV
ncbi:hypothetical protein Egran_04234 [Elaphomyces granulatus]|uniref:ASST-domain-containing protein n=1 Tax=Elaphomyces granulatus TaxID=519963 RepID=A0A232LV48_9EURO|nr:hypothetical protein Egran_04234 [Elaphomyces granulatus]